jgi:hypothetical protein
MQLVYLPLFGGHDISYIAQEVLVTVASHVNLRQSSDHRSGAYRNLLKEIVLRKYLEYRIPYGQVCAAWTDSYIVSE